METSRTNWASVRKEMKKHAEKMRNLGNLAEKKKNRTELMWKREQKMRKRAEITERNNVEMCRKMWKWAEK